MTQVGSVLFFFLLLGSGFSIDLTQNQTLFLFDFMIPVGSPNDTCSIQTSWQSSPKTLSLKPLSGFCFNQSPLNCSVISLNEFFVNNTEDLPTYQAIEKYIPDMTRDFIPLSCPSSSNSDLKHILIFNGLSGLTFFFMNDDSSPINYATANSTTAFSQGTLNIKGTVLSPINTNGRCSGVGVSGTIELFNFLPFPGLPYDGRADLLVGNLTLQGQSYQNAELSCFYAWMGAVTAMVECSNSQIAPGYEILVEVEALDDGFVVMILTVDHPINEFEAECLYVFKSHKNEKKEEPFASS